MPGMYFPSHFTRKLKPLYGSTLVVFTVNSAIALPPRLLPTTLWSKDRRRNGFKWRRVVSPGYPKVPNWATVRTTGAALERVFRSPSSSGDTSAMRHVELPAKWYGHRCDQLDQPVHSFGQLTTYSSHSAAPAVTVQANGTSFTLFAVADVPRPDDGPCDPPADCRRHSVES